MLEYHERDDEKVAVNNDAAGEMCFWPRKIDRKNAAEKIFSRFNILI